MLYNQPGIHNSIDKLLLRLVFYLMFWMECFRGGYKLSCIEITRSALKLVRDWIVYSQHFVTEKGTKQTATPAKVRAKVFTRNYRDGLQYCAFDQ